MGVCARVVRKFVGEGQAASRARGYESNVSPWLARCSLVALCHRLCTWKSRVGVRNTAIHSCSTISPCIFSWNWFARFLLEHDCYTASDDNVIRFLLIASF